MLLLLWALRGCILARMIWVCSLLLNWMNKLRFPVISEAKKLLPENAIIGISASSIEEAQAAVAAGADYLGIGTLFATPT